MDSSFQKAQMQKCGKIIVSALGASVLAYLTVLAFGCNDSLRKQSEDFDTTNMNSLQAHAVQIIWNGLEDSNPLIRANAIEVVAFTGQIKFMSKVQRLLTDEVVPVRFAAALAVGDLRYSPAKSSVSELLKDKDVNVIIAAAYAMGKLGDADYFEVIRKAINSDDQTVRANAAYILGKTGDTSSLNLLKWVLEDKDSSDKVRFQALEARARLGDEDVLQRLWAIVYSAYADDRIMGVRAMGALGTSKAKDILITKLDDDVLEVRLAAAEQLGMLNDPIGEPKVVDVFEKKLASGFDRQANERANVLAVLAIGRICTPTLTKFLPQLLKNESKLVRIAAAKAVFQCTMR